MKKIFFILSIVIVSLFLIFAGGKEDISYRTYNIGGDKFSIPTTFPNGNLKSGLADKDEIIQFSLDESTLQFINADADNSRKIFFRILAKPENFDRGIAELGKKIQSKDLSQCKELSTENKAYNFCKLSSAIELPIKIYGDEIFLLINKDTSEIRNIIGCQTKYDNLRHLCDSRSSLSKNAFLEYEFDTELLSRLSIIDSYLKELAHQFKENGEKLHGL